MAVGHANSLKFKPVPGIRIGTTCAGIKHSDRDDLTLIELAFGSVCAATFTKNAFCAAPVTIARQHSANDIRWLLINSGNANAGTGRLGIDDTLSTCRTLAEQVGVDEGQILPFSTGVIGERLPLEKMNAAIPIALESISEDLWGRAARAIMTTDTRPKGVSREFTIAGKHGVITGIAKGAGMIHPNMATMLAFIATDIDIRRDLLSSCLASAVEQSFNCISVDGDTSTNDACVVIATGRLGNPSIQPNSPELERFAGVLNEICAELAEQIIRDGEGATKLLKIKVAGAASVADAKSVATTIATSPLVKTACFAGDPNWGRILAAVGRAGVAGLDVQAVKIWLGDVLVVRGGALDPDYRESLGQQAMGQEEISIRVELGQGNDHAQTLSCDLSYDYVRINADYRT